jgi:sterol O-acyltransferase
MILQRATCCSYYRDWPWVQSGFFVLHTLSMMMKIHSYMAINGHMADNYYRMKRLEGMIEERVAEVEKDESNEEGMDAVGVTEEAWQRAVKAAREAADEEKERRKVRESSVMASSGEEIQPKTRDSAEKWNSLPAQRGTSILRQRANASLIEKRPSTSRAKEGEKAKTVPLFEGAEVIIRDPHPLATHPDQLISELSREVENLRDDLTSSPSNITTTADGVEREVYNKTVTWPSNVTLANFWDYLLIPTLVYELSYPRTKAIRPLYLLEKALATFGTFFVIYVITEHWIMPHQPDPSTPLLRTFLELAVPMMINVSQAGPEFSSLSRAEPSPLIPVPLFLSFSPPSTF